MLKLQFRVIKDVNLPKSDWSDYNLEVLQQMLNFRERDAKDKVIDNTPGGWILKVFRLNEIKINDFSVYSLSIQSLVYASIPFQIGLDNFDEVISEVEEFLLDIYDKVEFTSLNWHN